MCRSSSSRLQLTCLPCSSFICSRRDLSRRILNRQQAKMVMAESLNIKAKDTCRWDLVSLGEVMLRLDPGEGRIHTTRTFQVWEGGGEYNIARGLKRCFGLETAVVTALVDNPVGRLVQDLIFQGGVDPSHLRWVKDDGVGRTSRNGVNF